MINTTTNTIISTNKSRSLFNQILPLDIAMSLFTKSDRVYLDFSVVSVLLIPNNIRYSRARRSTTKFMYRSVRRVFSFDERVTIGIMSYLL